MPVIDIKNLKTARRYAGALLELQDIGKILSELEMIQGVFNENPNLKEFVEHPIISVSDKKDVIKQIFEDKTRDDVVDFLYVLLDEGRMNIFNTILECLKEEYGRRQGIVKATITSVIELEQDEKERLKKALEEKLNAKINIEYELEPSLMGGFSVNVQDKVIDLSLKSKFEQLKKLNRGI